MKQCAISILCGGAALGLLAFGLAAQAGQPAVPICNPLIQIANNLYSVTSGGKTITQFTSDGAAKDYAVISPNGSKVAYVIQGANETSYQVVDRYGRQGSFPVYRSQSGGNSASGKDYDAMGPLMGLFWSSNDVLRLEKHVGPTASRFEFHHIKRNLTGSSPLGRAAGGGDNCVLRRNSGQIACQQGGDVSIDGTNVYSESEFSGVPPIASFTLSKGESADTPGKPSYKVTVIGFDKDRVGLKITYPYADGAGEEMYVPPGYFLKVRYMYDDYGFFPTIINKKTDLVRIDEVKVALGSATFDPALAWQPHGPGLLLIRRADTQAMLFLIQPREIDRQKHKGRGKDDQWNVVAKAPIDMPSTVQTMLFATPSLLLLQTENGKFDEMPIHITNGQDKGKPSLTTGTVTHLPSTISVTAKGKSTKSSVLDWSCKSSHGDDDQGN